MKPVIVIQHVASEGMGTLNRVFQTQKIPFRLVRPFEGDRFPTLSEMGGVVVLGGSISSNDEETYPWLAEEVRWLQGQLETGIPIAGFCLGAQILARSLGQSVYRSQPPEIGWLPLELTESGIEDPVLAAAGDHPRVYQWHEDTFELPAQAVLLARSSNRVKQAYRIGDRVYGFQFHPEADRQVAAEWLSFRKALALVERLREQGFAETVQAPSNQLNAADQYQMDGFRMICALSELFTPNRYEPVPCGFYDQIEEMTEQGTEFVLRTPDGERHEGKALALETLNRAEFFLFQDHRGLLQALRLDRIRDLASC